MNEIKTPKKPLIYYYSIALLILLLFNFLAMPWMAQRRIVEVDYGTFITMTNNEEIGQVELQETENQILFTNKDNTVVYKTGLIRTLRSASTTPGPSLPERSSSRLPPSFPSC